jgi:tRNA(fMet)-specific endonuclease VapC
VTHLLDTDVVVDVLRHDTETRRRLAAAGSSVVMSSITLMELSYGIHRSAAPDANAAAVRALIDYLPVLDFGAAAAREAGAVRAELAAAGHPIGAYDVLIAGHARSAGLVVATGNVREFSRVTGLVVEDWRAG